MNQEFESFGAPEYEEAKTNKARTLHPAGTFVLRLADAFPAPAREEGKPRKRLVWLSAKTDAEGLPIWLFTTLNDNIWNGKKGGKQVGKPTKLRAILEALAGHALTDEEIKQGGTGYFIGRYALCTVSHYTNSFTGEQGHQVDNVVPMPEGMVPPEIDLETYHRPEKFGGGK